MSTINTENINFNQFLQILSLKKQYLQKLKKQYSFLNLLKQKNYKIITKFKQNYNRIDSKGFDNIIMYIIDITFSRSNTFLHVMDSSGKLKFFCSAGHMQYKGRRNKKSRFQVLRSIYHILLTKLRFLKGKPIALHLKNVGLKRFWILKKLKTHFLIKLVSIFNLFPFNGCRKKKVKRKKFKRKK
jgi:ribosomal protein S11